MAVTARASPGVGVGNPLGGAMGLIVIAGVTEIISVKAINTYYTDVVIGALLLAAVFLDRLRGGDKLRIAASGSARIDGMAHRGPHRGGPGCRRRPANANRETTHN